MTSECAEDCGSLASMWLPPLAKSPCTLGPSLPPPPLPPLLLPPLDPAADGGRRICPPSMRPRSPSNRLGQYCEECWWNDRERRKGWISFIKKKCRKCG